MGNMGLRVHDDISKFRELLMRRHRFSKEVSGVIVGPHEWDDDLVVLNHVTNIEAVSYTHLTLPTKA